MKNLLIILILAGSGLAGLRADVQLPSIFGDHMVLQQGASLPVWGTAAAGEQVTVTFAGRKGTVTADAQGRWKLTLPPVPVSAQPQDFVVDGKNRVVFTDVVAGEVWVCSGQSNMVLSARNQVTKEVEDKRLIRFFMTPTVGSPLPQETTAGKWHVCRVGEFPAVAYSSVGFYFATAIEQVRPGPIGMIQSAVGGTAILPWEDLAALEQTEPFRKLAASVVEFRGKLPQLMARYQTEILPAWEAKHLPGKPDTIPTAPGEQPAAEGTETGKIEDGAKPPVPPAQSAKTPPAPKPPAPPDHDINGPTTLFNGMVNPHIPYAIKGVLWYQGEANAQSVERGKEYAELLPLLISGWRAQWKQGNFPFLFVQLPAFTVNRPWQELRNSQFKSLVVPNTGMAVALDLNPTNNLHPPNKEEVGRRLSLLARRLAYGETLVASGPLYRSMQVEGNKIRISFTETGSGLALGGPPAAYRTPTADPAAAKDLLGFQIGPANGVCLPAQAKIDGNTVLVWSDAVAQPTVVTYAWDPHPEANLYNKEGLPASPFRTDDAPVFTAKQ